MNKQYLLLLCVTVSVLQARTEGGTKTDHIVVSPSSSKKSTIPQELAQWRAKKLELDGLEYSLFRINGVN